MVNVPDSLLALFSAKVSEQEGSFRITIPVEEVEKGTITQGETYRFAMVGITEDEHDEPARDLGRYEGGEADGVQKSNAELPVDPGEIRKVSITETGDRGDGVAKVERGYNVIVPDTAPGEEPTVRITRANPTFAVAIVVKHDH